MANHYSRESFDSAVHTLGMWQARAMNAYSLSEFTKWKLVDAEAEVSGLLVIAHSEALEWDASFEANHPVYPGDFPRGSMREFMSYHLAEWFDLDITGMSHRVMWTDSATIANTITCAECGDETTDRADWPLCDACHDAPDNDAATDALQAAGERAADAAEFNSSLPTFDSPMSAIQSAVRWGFDGEAITGIDLLASYLESCGIDLDTL